MKISDKVAILAGLRQEIADGLGISIGNDRHSDPLVAATQELAVAQYVTAFLIAEASAKS